MNCDTIWSAKPAQKWLQGLPVGNGHIGCMISGDPDRTTLSLNDDTLWSGYPRDYHLADFQQNIAQVRCLLLKNEREQAEELVETRLVNRFTQAYLPLGELIVCTPRADIREYRRSLDLSSGVASAQYIRNGKPVTSETYVSYPDDVLVHAVLSETALEYKITMTCALRYEVKYDQEGLMLTGNAPDDLIIGDVGNFYSKANRLVYDDAQCGMRFAARIQIITDGAVVAQADGLSVINARRMTLILCSATSYAKGDEYLAYAVDTAKRAAQTEQKQIKERHCLDHAALYHGMQLLLGEDQDGCALEDRLSRMRSGKATPSDLQLLFQFGRYLLIASSRRGTQAANLQGIWNKDPIPPWWCGYTLNINLQMNYWLADRTNLGECFEPLSAFVLRLCEAGRRTARDDYGASGSVAHHQSDLWAHSTPVGRDRERIPLSARWMMWNMPLPWLALQLYDHDAFHREDAFLRDSLYPVMKDAADFMNDTFMRVDGKLCNVPSTSPENMYRNENGRALAICEMSAMDIGISKEFALAYADVCARLGKAEDAAYWTKFAQDIKDYSIAKNGVLREWDRDFEQTEPGHRHFSMLFGMYPGNSLIGTPYQDAARKALQSRLDSGSGQTGWSAVWAALLLARFGEGNAAYEILTKLVRENIHDNLFGAHPPELFQIEANFGFTAAICELLIQETGGVVRILPALPASLPCGVVRGLLIHGGHTLSFEWKDGEVLWLEITAAADAVISLNAEGLVLDGAVCSATDSVSITLHADEAYRFSRPQS